MILSLALGLPLESIRRMPARDYARYRRFYARQPFGSVRGDLQSWLTARNVGEMLGGKLRSPAHAVWGGKRLAKARPKDAGPDADAEAAKRFAAVAGVPFTPAGRQAEPGAGG